MLFYILRLIKLKREFGRRDKLNRGSKINGHYF